MFYFCFDVDLLKDVFLFIGWYIAALFRDEFNTMKDKMVAV